MSNTVKYGDKLYEGTIQAGDMKNVQLYQGNIDSRALKPGPLYEGSIKRDAFRPETYGEMPNKTKPYKYYKLPPDYYTWWRRRTTPAPSTFTKSRQSQNRPAQTQEPRPLERQKENTPINATARSHDRQNVERPVHKQENSKLQVENKQRTEPSRSPRTPAAAPAKGPHNQTPRLMGPQEVTSTTKTQQNHKPSFKELLNPKSTFSERGASKTAPKKQGDQENQSQRYKQTTVSPFPPSSPEPAMTERNRGRVISPDAIRFQNSYFTRPEPVFPPMIPVSARDYATARPTPHTRQPNNNPLIPVNVPSLKTPRYNLIRRNQVSPALSYDDDYYDSLRRKYTSVPGYNAVGSILRSLNVYGD